MLGTRERHREVIIFEDFALNLTDRVLLRAGQPVPIKNKAFDVLVVLVKNAAGLTSKEELLDNVWHGEQRCENNLHQAIREIRRALDLGARQKHLIKTEHGVGYRFVAQVKRVDREGSITDDYTIWLRTAWHHWRRRTKEGFLQALDCFRRAAHESPTSTAAYEGMAVTHLMLATYGISEPGLGYQSFRAAHATAVELSGWTPTLLTDQGHALHIFERRRVEAEDVLRASLAMDADREQTYVALIMLMTALGRHGEAVRAGDGLRRINPIYPTLKALDVFCCFCGRDFDTAIALGEEAVRFDPYLHLGRIYYAQALEFGGQTDRALEHYELASRYSPDIPWLRALWAACLARNRRSP